MGEDRFLIENKLWMITTPIGVPIYDFGFRGYFDCRTPYSLDRTLPGVARVGAFADYPKFFHEAQAAGIALLNTPEEQERASTLTGWYPRVPELTPRSRWFSEIPSFAELADDFGLPFFVKGARQTSRHRATASVVKNREDYDRVVKIFREDDVRRWQTFVCRKWLPLRRVEGDTGEKMPPSYEFRTFWRRGTLLAAGRYWYDAPNYQWSKTERDEAWLLLQVPLLESIADFW